MEAIKNYTDSIVFGRNFIEIKDFSCELNFLEFEKEYLKEYHPFYVAVKLPIDQIAEIHFLEKTGFQFIETQIRETLRLKNAYNPVAFFPYKLEQVTDESDLDAILEIASKTFKHDRFTMDPMIPDGFSGNRYKFLVKQSFEQKDQFVYKFFNSQSGEILGFKTHKILGEDEALMYLGGIAEKYKRSPLPAINGYLELNELFAKGIKKVTTHISGCNYGVLNLEVKEFGYKVTQAFIVLRKIYP
jgi:hypothetical protein